MLLISVLLEKDVQPAIRAKGRQVTQSPGIVYKPIWFWQDWLSSRVGIRKGRLDKAYAVFGMLIPLLAAPNHGLLAFYILLFDLINNR
jgi:hypothetical protein